MKRKKCRKRKKTKEKEEKKRNSRYSSRRSNSLSRTTIINNTNLILWKANKVFDLKNDKHIKITNVAFK